MRVRSFITSKNVSPWKFRLRPPPIITSKNVLPLPSSPPTPSPPGPLRVRSDLQSLFSTSVITYARFFPPASRAVSAVHATRAVDFNRRYARGFLGLVVSRDPNESCWLTAPTGAATHLRRQLPRLFRFAYTEHT